jgi:hypothetical protein
LMALETVVLAAMAWSARNPTMRAGDLMMMLALGWAVWRVRDRFPNAMPGGEASGATLIEFHRGELLRERFSLSSVLLTLAPAVLALAVLITGMATQEQHFRLSHWAPLVALTGAWMLGLWWQVRRQEERLRRQISEVDATRPQ